MYMTQDYHVLPNPAVRIKNFGMNLFILVIMLSHHPVYSQTDTSRYFIALPQRQFIPEAGIEKQLVQKALLQFEQKKNIHVYLQLKKDINHAERSDLEKQGIQLQHYIGSQTWLASINRPNPLYFSQPDMLKKFPVFHHMRSIFEILPIEKLSRKVLNFGFGHYAMNPDSSINIVVQFFKDTPEKRCLSILNKYTLDPQAIQGPGMMNDWIVRVHKDSFKAFADDDEVQYVDEIDPPPGVQLDGSRGCANIDSLHNLPFNLTGKNIKIGVWDGGEIGDHPDLKNRVTIVEKGAVSDHATHVSGIIAGNGAASDTAGGGTPKQWAGVATKAKLFSYNYFGIKSPEEHEDAITKRGIMISNNSWLQSLNFNNPLFGDYILTSAKYDSIVCGVYKNRIPVIFCAGNYQDSVAGKFRSIPTPGATAKNVIAVGAVNSNDSSMTSFSSWGPTDDGRIKPEIVAAGCPIRSTISKDFIDIEPKAGPDGSDDYNYPYAVMCGTSMAAPAVTGLIALMMQENTNLLKGLKIKTPSTYKAILCNTAFDLVDNPSGGGALIGPDFIYGYGLVNGVKAVQTMCDYRFRESNILNNKDIKEFKIDVGNSNNLRVTLCWDDPAANPGDPPSGILKNDLDLLLINPDGKTYYTPWILDPDNPGKPATNTHWELSSSKDKYQVSYQNRQPLSLSFTFNYEDHTNNIEQVQVTNPEKGTWTAKVSASKLPYPNQLFSIASSHNFNNEERFRFRKRISLHWGAALPMGSFSDIYTNDLSRIEVKFYPVIIDFDLFPIWKFDLKIYASYANFKLRPDRKYLELKESKPYLFALTPKLCYHLFSWRVSPYLIAGGGYYMFKNKDNAFGYTFGFGLTIKLNDTISFQLGQDIHQIDKKDIEYSQIQAGFLYSF